MKIVSCNVGKVRSVLWNGREIKTGIFKFPVPEGIVLGTETVIGDSIVDRKYHGGIDQAVYGYSARHYEYWKNLYPDLNWEYGWFGENLTIDDLDEERIHSGDRFKIGTVILEATKPREPCMKLGLRFGSQDVLKPFWNSSKSGIYFKVVELGSVNPGDQMEMISSRPDKPTIAEMYASKRDQENE